MANELAKMTSAFLESQGMKHDVLGDDQEVIRTGVGIGENIEGLMFLIFFDDDRHAKVLSTDYVHVPPNKMDTVYPLLNDLNRKFRWAKFTVDEEGGLSVEADAVVEISTCGEECLEIMLRLASIANDAYPDIMGTIFGSK